MDKEMTEVSPLKIIRNEIEERSKNGKRRFALKDWEYRLDLDHIRVVAIIWAIEEMRIMEGKSIFVKIESYGEKGFPQLSEIEVPKDNKIGKAKVIGEFLKRRRAAQAKVVRYNSGVKATIESMKCLKPKEGKKYILISDSRKKKES